MIETGQELSEQRSSDIIHLSTSVFSHLCGNDHDTDRIRTC